MYNERLKFHSRELPFRHTHTHTQKKSNLMADDIGTNSSTRLADFSMGCCEKATIEDALHEECCTESKEQPLEELGGVDFALALRHKSLCICSPSSLCRKTQEVVDI